MYVETFMTEANQIPADPMPRAAPGFLGWLFAPQRRGALLVTPALLTLFLVNIFPLMWSFGLSFFDYKDRKSVV